MSPMLLCGIVSLAVAAFAAPLVAVFCRKLGIVDRPDGQRKLHARSVPLTGGPTLVLSLISGLAAALWVDPQVLAETRGDASFLLCLSAAAAVIVIVGMLDDRFSLRGRQKLLGQFIAACLMLPSGIAVDHVSLFGFSVHFGDLGFLFTLFWILGAINALNLIDGVDGLASTTGIVLALSVAAVTLILDGRPDGLLLSLALAGSLVGFLIHNFPPARMFLGDSGSMLIGLVLGCVALKCSVKQYTVVAMVMPTAIWAIPIFDVAMAIVRRRLTGRSIYATDRGHLHHCLLRQGHSGPRLLALVGTLCAITGLGAVGSAFYNSEMIAIVAVCTALLLLIVSRSFGHAEMTLLGNRFRRVLVSLVRGREGQRPILHHEQVRLQGQHEWVNLWDVLTAFAENNRLDSVELNVNMPSAGEAYHATWRTQSSSEAQEVWKTEIPLVVDGIRVGHIRFEGSASGNFSDWLVRLGRGLEPFEADFRSAVAQLQRKHIPARPNLPVLPSLIADQPG
ncbi:MAG: putative undecaprenyl-phosphate N-acetylglucosaminyl 1-phosphate transferase [Planctomycetota bacterium]